MDISEKKKKLSPLMECQKKMQPDRNQLHLGKCLTKSWDWFVVNKLNKQHFGCQSLGLEDFS